jgi:uncharacterized protein (TIGR02996 family)
VANERETLYAAVCANPEDDAARLAFADYLAGQGGREDKLWAEFIRASIAEQREKLWSREWRKATNARINCHNKICWQSSAGKVPWLRHLDGRVVSYDFDRGFVSHLRLLPKRFIDEGDQFFAEDPIRSVRFNQGAGREAVSAAELFACTHLARLHRVELPDWGLDDADLQRMADSEHLRNVRTLTLHGEQRFTAAGFVALMQRMPAFSELVAPVSGWFDDAFVTTLAASPALAKMTKLDVRHQLLSPRGLAALVTTEHGTNLRELWINVGLIWDHRASDANESRWRFTPEDGEAIAAVLGQCKFPNLQYLNAAGWRMGDAGLAALATAHFPALQQIDLSANDLTPRGLQALGASPLAKQLNTVTLGNTPVFQDKKVMQATRKLFPNAYVGE